MADYVNLQQSEVDEVQTRLATLHQEILQNDAAIRETIMELASMEGGFYIESISEKINCLLEELKSGPIAQLETCFTGTEEAVSAYVQGIIGIDTAF